MTAKEGAFSVGCLRTNLLEAEAMKTFSGVLKVEEAAKWDDEIDYKIWIELCT